MSIVSISWLQANINLPESKVVLLETTWIDKQEGYQKYLKKHIPGAQFFDMWQGVNSTHTRPRELPDVKQFEKHAQSLGINNDSHVVIYDQGKVAFGVRLWYTFKAFGYNNVSVLDGGKVFWEQLNIPMESGEPAKLKTGNIQLSPNTNTFLNYDELMERMEKEDTQLIDTRHPDYFNGSKNDLPPELSSTLGFAGLGLLDPDTLHKGHMPGAANFHYPRFTDPDTRCFISKEKLTEIMDEIGIDVNKPIIGTCYLGVTACFIPLTVSQILGKQVHIPVYLGSWTEYSQKAPKEKVETGAARK